MSRTLGNIALGVGAAVALLTVASQLFPLPLIGGDFANVALIGLLAAAFGLVVASGSSGACRRRARIGVVLASAPVVLLVYFLAFRVS